MVFEQAEIEDVVIDHFAERFKGQRDPSSLDDNEPLTETIEDNVPNSGGNFTESQFEEYICKPFTISELELVLKNLPKDKSSGPDNIANELIKNTSFKTRLYLQLFLNKILEEGRVPNLLNKGKCVLVFKVKLNNIDKST